MTTHVAAPSRVYVAGGWIGWQAAGFLVAGGVILLLLLVQFLLLLVSPPGPTHQIQPGLIGGLTVLPLALIARGVFLLRSVIRVTLDDAGVHLEGFIARRTIRWSEIERLQRDKRINLMAGGEAEVLSLLGPSGRRLAAIPDTILRFEDLAADVQAGSSAARGAPTYDAAADESRKDKKKARARKLATVTFGVFTVLFVVMAIVSLNEWLHERRYATEGVRTDATLVRRYMRRVTPYVEYAFTDQAGVRHTRETMVEPAAWEALDGAGAVTIEYLATAPNWNRLVAGDNDTRFDRPFLLLCVFGSLFFGGMFLLSALGFDLETDGPGMKLTRRGKTIRAFGLPRTQPTGGPPWPYPTPPYAPSGSIPPGVPPPAPGPTGPAGPYYPPPWPGGPAWQNPAWPAYPPGVVPAPAGMPVPPAPAPVRSAGPKGIIVLGVLSVAFGGIGVLFGLLRAVLIRRESIELGAGHVLEMNTSAVVRYWNAADTTLAALLMIAGVGLLGIKRWGRRLGLGVAVLQVLSSLAAIAYFVHRLPAGATPGSPESVQQGAGLLGGVLGQVIGMIFPIILAVLLARRSTGEVMKPDSSQNSGT